MLSGRAGRAGVPRRAPQGQEHSGLPQVQDRNDSTDVPESGKRGPEFFRKASVSFLLRFGGLALQFLGAVLVARLLGAERYGVFTYASTWAVFVGTLLPLGLDALSVRELPAYLVRHRHGLVNGYMLTVLGTIAVTSVLAGYIILRLNRADILDILAGIEIVVAYSVIHALILSASNGLNAYQRILTSQFLETIVRQVIYLSLIGLTLLVGFELTARRAFELTMIAALPVLGAMLFLLNRMRLSHHAGGARPEFELPVWFAGAMPLLVTALANRLQHDLDVLMVGGMLGHFEVGIYRAAARAAVLVTIANMVALQLVGPMLSRAISRGDPPEAQRLLSQAATVSFLPGVPILLVFGFGASLYLGLYGAEFVQASASLRILMLGQASIVLAGADAVLLIMLRKERLILLVTGLGVGMNFGLNLALIPLFGIEGAATASMISMIVVRLTLVSYILRSTGYDPTIWPVLRNLLQRRRG